MAAKKDSLALRGRVRSLPAIGERGGGRRKDSKILLRVFLAHCGAVKFALNSYVVPAVGSGFEHVEKHAESGYCGVSESVCGLRDSRPLLGAFKREIYALFSGSLACGGVKIAFRVLRDSRGGERGKPCGEIRGDGDGTGNACFRNRF